MESAEISSVSVEGHPDELHPDFHRKAAFDEWHTKLGEVEAAVASLKTMSCDPRLRALASEPLPQDTPNTLSDQSMRYLFDSTLQRFAALEKDMRFITAKAAQKRNHSHHLVLIDRLPPELLASIFALTHDKKESWPYDLCFESRRNLSLVCYRWYFLSVEMSSLWAYLDFTDAPLFTRTLKHIKRSGDFDFSVKLDLYKTRSAPRENLERTISFMCSEGILPRISHLEIHGTQQQLNDAFAYLLFLNSPISVFSFFLNLHYSNKESSPVHSVSEFAHELLCTTPYLARLRMTRSFVVDLSHPTYHTLESLHLTTPLSPPTDYQLSVFLQNVGRTLQHLEIDLHSSQNPQQNPFVPPETPYVLSSLTKLILKNLNARFSQMLFSSARAPSLHSIFIGDMAAVQIVDLIRFIQESGCGDSVQSLTLEGWRETTAPSHSPSVQSSLLASLPNLTGLVLHRIYLSNDTLPSLAPAPPTPTTATDVTNEEFLPTYSCPSLTQLTLTRLHNCTPRQVVDIVSRRVTSESLGTSSIKELVVKDCGYSREFVGDLAAEAKEAEGVVKAFVRGKVSWKWELSDPPRGAFIPGPV